MTENHRDLIEEGRELHRPGRNGCCLACPGWVAPVRWPCVTARLADALEYSIAYTINHGADLRLERDTALARAAQAERLGNVAAERMRVAEERADDALAMEASANARAAGWSIDLEAAFARLAKAERERDALRSAIDAAWTTTQAALGDRECDA